MLEKWEIPYDEIRIDRDAAALSEFRQVTNGARTVPQIVIDGRPIGGFDELTEMHMDGDLDELMQE
jgi:glutaredoxin 3